MTTAMGNESGHGGHVPSLHVPSSYRSEGALPKSCNSTELMFSPLLGVTMSSLPSMVPSTDSLPLYISTVTQDLLPLNVETCGVLPALQEIEGSSEESGSDGASEDEEASPDGWVPPRIRLDKNRSVESSTKDHTANRYHAGKPMRIRSGTAGKEVDAIITDSNGERVRVMYFLGGKCFSKVLPRYELAENESPSDSTSMVAGAPVLVRSSTVNAWFKGTVLWVKEDTVKVHWWHNGRSCIKMLRKNSPDLRICFRKMHSRLTERCS